MKVKNNKGHKVTIKPEHEALVRQMHAKGDHAGISALVEGYSKKRPKMKQMGGQPPAPQGDPSQQEAPQGGDQQAQMQQLMQMVAQALQQGQKPEQVMQMLVQQGVPQEVAQQVIQMVMQQMQSGQQQGPAEEQQEPQQEAPQQGMQEGAPQMKAGGKLNWVVPAYGYGQNGVAIDGQPQDPQQQLMHSVATALSKGAKPEQLVADLTSKGYPQDQATQLVQSVMQQLSQTSEQEQPVAKMGIRMAQIGTGITGQKPYQNKYQNYGQSPVNPALGYYGNISANLANQARDERMIANEARVFAANPNNTPEQTEYYNQLSSDSEKQGKVDSITSGIAGVNQGIHSAVEGVIAPLSVMNANRQAKIQEQGMQAFANSNRAPIKPINADYRYGDAPATGKYGVRLKRYQIGGTATEGSDFRSGDPNVMTEKGETISDPTQGPTGPDGRPTGAVVHDTTGDNHSDPSGGNAYKLGKDAVVHSKVLGVRIGDFIEFAKGFPDAEKIISTIMAKFKDPNKEVSFAKIAALFDTEKLLKEVKQIEKKLEKAEKHGGPQATEPAQVTSKLNRKTLQGKMEQTKAEIQSNSEATGAQGPIHAMSEGLKHAGAYGPKVQGEAQQQEQVPTAKHGGKITMKSKKLMLPKAQFGNSNKEHEISVPYDPYPQPDNNHITSISNMNTSTGTGGYENNWKNTAMNVMSYDKPGMVNDTSWSQYSEGTNNGKQDYTGNFLQTQHNNPFLGLPDVNVSSTERGAGKGISYGQMSPVAQELFKSQVNSDLGKYHQILPQKELGGIPIAQNSIRVKRINKWMNTPGYVAANPASAGADDQFYSTQGTQEGQSGETAYGQPPVTPVQQVVQQAPVESLPSIQEVARVNMGPMYQTPKQEVQGVGAITGRNVMSGYQAPEAINLGNTLNSVRMKGISTSGVGQAPVVPSINMSAPIAQITAGTSTSRPVVNGDTQNNYSRVVAPGQSLVTNPAKFTTRFTQYKQKGQEDPDFLNAYVAAVAKGDATIPDDVGNWNAMGQKQHADGTYGPITVEDLYDKQASPDGAFMGTIAGRYGETFFDPGNTRKIVDPKTNTETTVGQLMIRDFEDVVNESATRQGLPSYFGTDITGQPFGKKLFGAWHMSAPIFHQTSYGGARGTFNEYDKDLPILYHNIGIPAAPEPAKTIDIPDYGSAPQFPIHQRSIYQDGYIGQGELLPLLFANKPVPYINYAAGDEAALSSNVRKERIPLNDRDIVRQQAAATWNNSNDPISQARQAQIKATGIEERGKRLNDVNIKNAEAQYAWEQEQNRLKQAAGQHTAEGLDKAVVRVAKRDSASEDRVANAASRYLSNRKEHLREQRASAMAQQFFANVGWDPIKGFQNYAGGKDIISAGAYDPSSTGSLKDQLMVQQIKHLQSTGKEADAKAASELMASLFKTAKKQLGGKLGGKIGRATPKIMKKKK